MGRKRFIIAALLALPVLLGALLAANCWTLELRLTGPGALTLEYGQVYDDPGAEAVLRGRLYCTQGLTLDNADVTRTGQVDRALGRYELAYQARFLFWQARAVRTVTVADTCRPVITLEEDPEGGLLEGRAYRERGFHAYDDHDGDITHLVRWEEGPGYILYMVADSSGNPAQARRELPVDTQPPQITLEGGSSWAIAAGTVYEEPGYRAEDDWDGDLTAAVEVSGAVDWLTPGVYPVTYTVRDAGGNETAVTRQVEVNAWPRPTVRWPGEKTIYLTFDDGPGPYTDHLLDILDRWGVKATFFVTDTGYDTVMGRIVERGHSIGIHTVSHDYAQVYAGPEAYFQDLRQMEKIIYDNTGVHTTLVRFPGGSSNTVSRDHSPGLMTLLTQAVQDAGYQYFDWNVDSGDAAGANKARTIADNVARDVAGKKLAMVLLHDIHACTVDAVEDIIRWGLDQGYTFRPLTQDSPGFHHEVQN